MPATETIPIDGLDAKSNREIVDIALRECRSGHIDISESSREQLIEAIRSARWLEERALRFEG